MNRNRIVMIGLVALVMSVVVTYLAYRMVQNRITPPEDTSRIVVASKKLTLGMRLTADDVTTKPWPKSTPIEGSFADIKLVDGRGVTVDMSPNEPVLESKLAPKDGGVGLTAIIPKGSRAVAVKVNDVVGVAGFVIPGTYVDVILTGQPRQNEEIASKVIVENVKVLTAGQTLEKDPNGKPQSVQVVTLLVSPEEAEKIALAVNDGRMQLALRNPLDKDRPDPAAIPRPELFYGGRPAVRAEATPVSTSGGQGNRKTVRRKPLPPPVPPQLYFEVELIQGDKITKYTVK